MTVSCTAALLLVVGLYAVRPSSANARMMIWNVCLTENTGHRIAGSGTGTFPAVYMVMQAHHSSSADEETRRMADDVVAPYNEMLRVYVENGAIGLFLCSVFAVLLFGNLHRSHTKDGACTGIFALVAFFVFSQFSYPLSVPSVFLPFVALVAADVQGEMRLSALSKSVRAVRYAAISMLLALCCLFAMRIGVHRQLSSYSRLEAEEALANNALQRWLLMHDSHLLTRCLQLQMLVGDYEEALPLQLRQLQYVNNTQQQMNLARTYEAMGDSQNALIHYRQAQAMRPGLLEPLFAELQILQQTDTLSALAMARQIVRTNPKIRNNQTDAMKAGASKFIHQTTTLP